MVERCKALLVFALLLACSGNEQASVCSEVTCSDHGECFDSEGEAACTCDTGYVVAGLNCVKPSTEPAILHVSAKQETIQEGETASFLLVVNGPVDVDDPVDAVLETMAGKAVVQFVPGSLPRSYQADLSWAQMNALEPLTFLAPEPRQYVVRVWNDDGWEDSRTVSITPSCPDDSGACRGHCDARMVVHDSLAMNAADCAQWSCSEPTPVGCLSQPTAWLWMAKGQYDALLADLQSDVEVDGLFYFMGMCGEVGVEIHGGLARKFAKKSFKVKFNRAGWFPYDPFAKSDEPVVAPKGFKQFIFKAHWVDPSLMRDHLTHDLARALGGLAPRVTHANFILNGRYHGIYALTESILEDYFLRLNLPGNGSLYKAVNHNANFKKKVDASAGYEKKMGDLDETEDLAELLEAIAETGFDAEEFEEEVGEHLDLDLYLAYSVTNAYANNQDAFTKNYYLYAEHDEPFLTVNWDADATFGISWDGTLEEPDTGGLWGKANALSAKLSKISEYKAANAAIYAEALADGPLAPDALHDDVEALVQTIGPDIRFEECRWDKESGFDEQVDLIHAFIDARTAVVEEWLE